MTKQLSQRALNFIKKQGRSKEYDVKINILEKHINFYQLKNSAEILRFHENFTGLNIQDIVIHIFTPSQVKEHKKINTLDWEGQVLFPINDSFYIAENGEIALKDYRYTPYDFYFYFERFETFIEQQAFFKEYQDYTRLPGLGNELMGTIDLLSDYFSDYEVINECSDKYHRIWKNHLNLIHARLYPEGWSIFFDGISENERHNLIEKLKTQNLII